MGGPDLLILEGRTGTHEEAAPAEPELSGGIPRVDKKYTVPDLWDMDQGKNKRLTKKEIEERVAAGNKQCSWHSWRSAYAVCAYCGRPFCAEDLVEENGGYYCLEDIDRVVNYQTLFKSSFSSNIGFIAGILFLMPSLIFVYFGTGDLISSMASVQTVGIVNFVTNFSHVYTSAFPLVGVLLSFMGLVSSTMIFLSAKRSAPTGIFFGALMSLFFAYQYINGLLIYNLAIAAIAAVATAMLIVSRVTARPEPEEMLTHTRTGVEVSVPNVGRF